MICRPPRGGLPVLMRDDLDVLPAGCFISSKAGYIFNSSNDTGRLVLRFVSLDPTTS